MNELVLVFVDHDRGTVDESSLQALAFARTIVPGADVAAVVIGNDAPLAIDGVSAIYHTSHSELTDYAPEVWGDVLQQLAVEVEATAVVATGTDRGNEVLAHVAAIADEPFAANVVHAKPGSPWQIRRTRWGGSLLEDATLSAKLPILSCALHAFPADPGANPQPTQHRAISDGRTSGAYRRE